MSRLLARVFVLFAMVILGVACATPMKVSKVPVASKSTTFILHVDELFSPVDRAIVIDSFVEWERDTHGVVKFTLDSEPFNSDRDEFGVTSEKCTYEVYVISMESKNRIVKKVENGDGTVLGFTISTCKRRLVAFVMDRLRNPVLLHNVGVHETGHLIGLDHIPVPKESVMFPSIDKATRCPSQLDMKQLCMIHKCDWRDMASCDG